MFYKKKWTLNFYIDVQNVYNFKADEVSRLVTEVNADQSPVYMDPPTNSIYKLKYVEREGGSSILPTIGIIVEF